MILCCAIRKDLYKIDKKISLRVTNLLLLLSDELSTTTGNILRSNSLSVRNQRTDFQFYQYTNKIYIYLPVILRGPWPVLNVLMG